MHLQQLNRLSQANAVLRSLPGQLNPLRQQGRASMLVYENCSSKRFSHFSLSIVRVCPLVLAMIRAKVQKELPFLSVFIVYEGHWF